MRVAVIVFGCLCVAFTMATEANQIACYNAKTCIHSGKPKCGVDKNGEHRRFFDNCDMMEYNCLRFKDFITISKDRCKDLPPLDPKMRKYE